MKRPRLSAADHDTIRDALVDAIGWADGLADAHRMEPTSTAYLAAKQDEGRYRALLKRYTGSDRTPLEIHFDGMKSISLFEVLKRGPRKFGQKDET